MPRHFLHGDNIRTLLQQLGHKRAPEVVRGDIAAFIHWLKQRTRLKSQPFSGYYVVSDTALSRVWQAGSE